MKDVLVEKLGDMYGSGAAKEDDQVSLSSTAIRHEVEGMLSGAAAPVTEANLRRLDTRLRRHAQGRPVDDDMQSMFSVSAYTAGSSVPRKVTVQAAGPLSITGSRPITPAMSVRGSAKGSARGGSLKDSAKAPGSARFAAGHRSYGDAAYAAPAVPSAPLSARGVDGERHTKEVDWSTLDRIAAKLHEQDANNQRVRERELQHRLKKDLDKQIADARLKTARERDEERVYFEKQMAALGNWQDTEKVGVQGTREKATAIQKERDLQVEAQRARKEEERRAARQEADEIKEKVRQAEEQDRKETEERRLMRKDRIRQALEDSTNAAARRGEELRKKKEQEDKALEDYRNRMLEREQQSKEEKQAKFAGQQQFLESNATTRAVAEKQMQDELAAKAELEQAAKNAATEATQKMKSEKLKEQRLETQRCLLDQMRTKSDRKQKEAQDKQTLGSALEVDATKYKESEVSKNAQQRQRALDHRAELERQISLKMTSPKKKDAMSASEVAMNKRLLDRIEGLELAGEKGSVM